MHEFPADDGRLAELILYISARCADWSHFDQALLDRILFQSDFLQYRTHGAPITGQAYRRGPSGPAPRGLSRVLRGLAREFAVVETPEGDGLHVRRRPAALRPARLAGFTAEELATVDEVLAYYRTYREGHGRRVGDRELTGIRLGREEDGGRDGEAEREGAAWRDGNEGQAGWLKARPTDADYLEIPWQEAGPRAILPYALALSAPGPGKAVQRSTPSSWLECPA